LNVSVLPHTWGSEKQSRFNKTGGEMDNREKVQHLFKAALLGAAFFMIVWWDISSQMNFTENTRAGTYERAASQ